MIRFRSSSPHPSTPVSGGGLAALIADAIRPGNFFASPELRLDWCHGREEVYWELFRGHALDHTKTRHKQVFDACLRHDVTPGIHTQNVEHTRYRLSQGWRLIALSSDGSLMARAARFAIESTRANGIVADCCAGRPAPLAPPATARCADDGFT